MLYFNELSNALFVGVEQEGKRKGSETLFIVGMPKTCVVQDYFKSNVYPRAYLGAGFCSPFTYDYSKELYTSLSTEFPSTTLTMEVPVNKLNSINWNYDEIIVTLQLGDNNFIAGEKTDFYNTLMYLRSQDTLNKVFIKYDQNQTVIVMALKDISISHYADFNGADKILYNSK